MTRPAARVAAVLAMVLVLPACSTVPSNSPTVQITQAPARPADEIGLEPLGPEPGDTPEDIVRGFIDAAASPRQGHPVAREHLAREAAGTWSDEAGITIISADYATVTTVAGSVAVSAILVGTVDEFGVFAVGGSTFRREFTLEQVEGEWRISNPSDGLIIAEPDFERLYDERAAYFLDQTGQRVVPDPRHLIRGEAQPTALVQRLLEGPSAALAAGVFNPLSGLQLRSAVSIRGQEATVDLRGVATDPAPQLAQICAQLVWTLTQSQPSIRSVVVRVDGEEVDLEGVPAQQTVDDWASLDPDAVPVDGVGHYLSGGALRTVTAGEPAPVPAGTGAYALTGAAVAADASTGELSFLVGVQPGPSGVNLVAGPYGGELAFVLDAASSFSQPSIAATREEAWVVRDGTSVVRVPKGASPQAVNVPTLSALGRAEELRLSPDGVRAAFVVEGPAGLALYVGTVVRAEDGSVAVRDLRDVAPSLSQVADVAWGDSDTLLVLAADAGEDRTAPYSVGVDGWGLVQVPTAGLPSAPSTIAGAPTRQPLVDAGGTIWQLAGGTWVTLVRGREPLAGAAPFYPL